MGLKHHSWAFVLLVLAGIAFQILMSRNVDPVPMRGADFRAFYTGAKLLGTAELYSLPAMRSVASDITDRDEYYPFVRPPWFAAVVWPLSPLPAEQALTLWRGLLLAAVAGFALISPTTAWPAFAAFAWSFPLFSTVATGQDVPFVLLILGISVLLYRSNRHFAAGLLASLCSVKFHLFLLVALVLVQRRCWKVLSGLAAGLAALGVVSTLLAGPFWWRDYLGLILNPVTNPHPESMYNLRGLFSGSPWPRLLEGVSAAVVTAAVWWIGRRSSMGVSLCAALVGGILVGHHSYLGDMLLIVPVCLWLAMRSDSRLAQAVSLLLLVPFPYMLLPIGFTVGLCLCLLAVLAVTDGTETLGCI